MAHNLPFQPLNKLLVCSYQKLSTGSICADVFIIVCLIHWGRVTHTCITKLTIDNATSHYLNQWWNINSNLGNKLQWNLKQNLYFHIQENAFENVILEMTAILYQPQCVNDCNATCVLHKMILHESILTVQSAWPLLMVWWLFFRHQYLYNYHCYSGPVFISRVFQMIRESFEFQTWLLVAIFVACSIHFYGTKASAMCGVYDMR